MCHHALLYRITTGLLSLIKVLYYDVDYANGNNLLCLNTMSLFSGVVLCENIQIDLLNSIKNIDYDESMVSIVLRQYMRGENGQRI